MNVFELNSDGVPLIELCFEPDITALAILFSTFSVCMGGGGGAGAYNGRA